MTKPKMKLTSVEQREILERLEAYSSIEQASGGGKASWILTHRKCGETHKVLWQSLLKSLERNPHHVPCTTCNPVGRANKNKPICETSILDTIGQIRETKEQLTLSEPVKSQVKQDEITRQRTRLESHGEYINIKYLGVQNSKSVWQFTHTQCGESQEMIWGNIEANMQGGHVPCRFCGATLRTFNANETKNSK